MSSRLSSQMPEEESFAVLVRLMEDYRMREMFKPSMSELGVCIYQLEVLVQVRHVFQESFSRVRRLFRVLFYTPYELYLLIGVVGFVKARHVNRFRVSSHVSVISCQFHESFDSLAS